MLKKRRKRKGLNNTYSKRDIFLVATIKKIVDVIIEEWLKKIKIKKVTRDMI